MPSDIALREIYFAGLLAASVIRAAYTRGSRRGKTVRQGSAAADWVILALGGAGFALPVVRHLSSWLDFADYSLPPWAAFAGIALYPPLLWLLGRSYADLGPNWHHTLRIREGHRLVTSGVYAWMRHPLYTAHTWWGVVQMLLVQNWLAGPGLLLAMVVTIIWRIPAEEAQMAEHFGDEYLDYMSRTGRLLPTRRAPRY